jgi:hypothetical protein
VSFEELRNVGEEKDATDLELHQAAETARTDLETEKKQVEGESPLSDPLFVAWIHRDLLLTYLSFVFRRVGRCRDVNDASVHGPYNKDPTIKNLSSRGVYNKFHAHI